MREKFIPTSNDLNYYPLLYKALEATKWTVVEMGMGHGSTPLLHEYCEANKRKLASFDNNEEWATKFYQLRGADHSIINVSNTAIGWDGVFDSYRNADVIFIDHAPGERRKVDLEKFKHTFGIIVIHDTEPHNAGYGVRELFGQFKYKVEVKSNVPNPYEVGAWATALSNNIDITKWSGETFGEYKIEI